MEDRSVVLLEQLIGQAAGLRREVLQLQETVKQMCDRMDRLEQRMDRLEGEVRLLRTDVTETRREFSRLVAGVGEAQAAFRKQTEVELDRRAMLLGLQVQEKQEERYADLERRIAELEAAERRRKEGQGA